MTLRADLIEAGANSVYHKRVGDEALSTFDDPSAGEREVAAMYLDAFLVYLADNKDKWEEAVMDHFGAPVLDAAGLLAVLREPDV